MPNPVWMCLYKPQSGDTFFRFVFVLAQGKLIHVHVSGTLPGPFHGTELYVSFLVGFTVFVVCVGVCSALNIVVMYAVFG